MPFQRPYTSPKGKNMNMTTKSALVAIAFAAGMFASSAQATVLSVSALPTVVADQSADVEKLFAGAIDFTDHYTFTTDSSAYVSDAYLHSVYPDIDVTSFSIHTAGGALVGTTGISVDDTYAVPATGTGNWTFSNVLLAANTSYYVEVSGKVMENSGSSYGFTVNVTPVPEPETYALMLAGLGVIGFMRRRKNA
jgi:hypothetical protein